MSVAGKGRRVIFIGASMAGKTTLTQAMTVSYTHLDVYKRQAIHWSYPKSTERIWIRGSVFYMRRIFAGSA